MVSGKPIDDFVLAIALTYFLVAACILNKQINRAKKKQQQNKNKKQKESRHKGDN